MAAVQIAKQTFSLVGTAAFLCGALAIALEMILMRLATRYTGSAADGTTAALTIYLLGLLAGAALVLTLNKKNGPKILAPSAIGLLTTTSALVGFLSSLPTPNLPLLQVGGGLVLCAATIFPPALLAGMIFPVLLLLSASFYFGSAADFAEGADKVRPNGKVILLYLISNLGSALGAVAATIWLLPHLGVAHSLYGMAVGWLGVLALLLPLLLQLPSAPRAVPTAISDSEETAGEEEIAIEADSNSEDIIVSRSGPYTYISVFLAALAGLLFECLAIRLLALICGASFVTTTSAVAATLLAITLGSRLAINIPVNKNTRLLLALAGAFAAAGLAMTVLLLPHLSNVFQAIRHLTYEGYTQEGLAQFDAHRRWLAYLYPRIITALIFCLPGATALSLIFPLAAKNATRTSDMLRLYIAGGAGTALAPIILMVCLTLPPFATSTMEFMLRALTVTLAALAVVGLAGSLRGKKAAEALLTKFLCLASLSLALLLVLFLKPLSAAKIDLGLSFVSPRATIKAIQADDAASRRIFYKEGRSATVSVFANDQANLMSLRCDGKVEGTTPIDYERAASASDLPTQSLLALLPLLWRNPEAPATSAFVVGYGTGTTAATLATAMPGMALTVAEIEPAVVEGGKNFSKNAAAVPRPAVTTGDARQMLQQSQTAYDLIASQPAEPWVQGSTNLYSAEFYRLVRSRLKKGGAFCQWLQLYGMDRQDFISALKTIQSVFPDCLVFHPHRAGEILILGFGEAGTIAAIEPSALEQNFNRPTIRPLLTARESGIENTDRLRESVLLKGENFTTALKKWQDVEPGAIIITDDNLALELDTLSEIENPERSIEANLDLLKQPGKSLDRP